MGRHSSSDDDVEMEGSGKKVPDDADSDDGGSSSSGEELRSTRKSKKSKSSHKKKKSKDKKRHKKKSRKHRRRSSSSEDSSGSDDDEAEEWVVKAKPEVGEVTGDLADKKTDEETFKKPKLVEAPVRGKAAQDGDGDEWDAFNNAVRSTSISNEGKKLERKKQKELERGQKSIDTVGVHVNELNPYWKDGGTGLPDEESVSKPKPKDTQVIGDGGLSYLRKAFVRAKEQSKEEGRTLEEVVSERWGSLEKFLGMLEEAERKAEKTDDRPRKYDDRKRFKRPDRDSDDEDSHRHSGSSSRHRDRRHDRHHRDRRRSRSKDRNNDSSRGWRKKRDSPERSSRRDSPERSSRRDSPERSLRKESPVSTTKRQMSPILTKQRISKDDSTGKYASKSNINSSPPPVEPEDMELDKPEIPKPLTDKEMNELGAKLLKAEMLGNTTLMEELKKKISDAESARQDYIKNGGNISQPNQSTKVVTKVLMDSSRGRKKDKVTETHKDGERVRYFPDDDKHTLKNGLMTIHPNISHPNVYSPTVFSPTSDD